MILSVSARTDVVARYTDWLVNRFREGYVLSRNPIFPNRVTRYELRPDAVDAIVFCSKNYAPLLPHVPKFVQNFRTLFHYTITAYGKDVEPNVPSVDESIETLLRLSSAAGAKRVVWRYDPVLLTATYTPEAHASAFEHIARALTGKVRGCIFSFVDMYAKLQTNMPEIVPMDRETKRKLAAELGKIAAGFHLPIQTCADEADYSACGVRRAGCVTLTEIADANGCSFKSVRHMGNRLGCTCITMRDIGFYDSCPNGCKYCYANTSAEKVRSNRALHDPVSPLLIGRPEEGDVLMKGVQTSLLKTSGGQLSLFD